MQALTSIQQEPIDLLPSDPTYLFPEADKGLGPCAVKFIQYIEDVLVHLCNEEIYEQMSEEDALFRADALHTEIKDWLSEYESLIGKHAHRFFSDHIDANLDSPFGQFYILYKIHKGKGADGKWPTRPVSSDVTSLPHALGKWITEIKQPSYFKDSFELKTLLDLINWHFHQMHYFLQQMHFLCIPISKPSQRLRVLRITFAINYECTIERKMH